MTKDTHWTCSNFANSCIATERIVNHIRSLVSLAHQVRVCEAVQSLLKNTSVDHRRVRMDGSGSHLELQTHQNILSHPSTLTHIHPQWDIRLDQHQPSLTPHNNHNINSNKDRLLNGRTTLGSITTRLKR